jgi:hypothetical protein
MHAQQHEIGFAVLIARLRLTETALTAAIVDVKQPGSWLFIRARP